MDTFIPERAAYLEHHRLIEFGRGRLDALVGYLAEVEPVRRSL